MDLKNLNIEKFNNELKTEYRSIYHYFQTLNLNQEIAWVGIGLGIVLVIIGLFML